MPADTLLAANSAAALTLADHAQTASAGIVSRTLLQTPEARVILFTFAEGQELTKHTSRRRALVQILTGECDFLFEGEWRRLTAGTLLHMPPNHEHAVRAVGPFSMLLTLCFEASVSTSS